MAELSTRTKISMARAARAVVMAGRRMAGATSSARVVRRGVMWDLNLDEGIDFAIYLLGGFEIRTLRTYAKVVRPGDVVLDIGANIGAHALPLAQLVGDSGRVIAIEPTDYAYGKLTRNIRLNGALSPRVTPMQLALLADVRDTLRGPVCASWPLTGTDTVDEVHGGKPCSTSGAQVSTVDAVVDSASLTRVSFMKLDVDGHEHSVLLGSAQTLARFKPTILMEWAPACAADPEAGFGEALRLLRQTGYEFTPLGSAARLSLTEGNLASVVRPGASINLLLRCR